jgi:hypothetical protein
MAKHEAGYERLGAKVLSLPDVIAQSVGFMGPVFSSAFVIPWWSVWSARPARAAAWPRRYRC